jgi:hypothetical protein
MNELPSTATDASVIKLFCGQLPREWSEEQVSTRAIAPSWRNRGTACASLVCVGAQVGWLY